MTPPGDVDVEPEELVDRVRPGRPGDRAVLTARMTRSRSAAAKSSARARLTRSRMAGITLHEAITASESLKADEIAARVIDLLDQAD